ncbi:hypothetical protein ACHAWF_011773, partial [Thalassiosira exigua]
MTREICGPLSVTSGWWLVGGGRGGLCLSSFFHVADAGNYLEITLWIDKLNLDGYLPPEGFPLTAIKEAIVLVMNNNIFEWGNCYFLQLFRTAMGTSAACIWATIYFAIHEIDKLLPNYGGFFPSLNGSSMTFWNLATWNRFKNDTNDFGVLRCKFDEPSTSVVFLDLNIRIERNAIKTSTYQKPINLYQYIPPSSAHPPGMMRGIMFFFADEKLKKASKQQATRLRGHDHQAVPPPCCKRLGPVYDET